MNYNQNMNMNRNMPNLGQGQSQGQGPNMMGYPMNNPTNYNMNPNPNMNSNMNNQPPAFFITGKFGKRDIAKEDLNTFVANLKSTEWTNNSIYQLARNTDVSTTLSSNQNMKGAMNQRKGNFDSFYLNVSMHLNEFDNYKNEYLERNQKMAEEIERRRKEFLKNFFTPNMSDPGIKELLSLISAEKCLFLAKDPTLGVKLEKILQIMNPPKPQPQPQYQPQPQPQPQPQYQPQPQPQQSNGFQQGGFKQDMYASSNNNLNAPPTLCNPPSSNPPYVQANPNPNLNSSYVQPKTNMYGQPSTTTSIYGQPQTGSIYGQPSPNPYSQPYVQPNPQPGSVYGQNTNMYGRQPTLTNSVFGQPIQPVNQFCNPNPQNSYYVNPPYANNPNLPYAQPNPNYKPYYK